MISTMIAVCTVSARVGQTTLLNSVFTSPKNLAGFILAIIQFLQLFFRVSAFAPAVTTESDIGSHFGKTRALITDSPIGKRICLLLRKVAALQRATNMLRR
jgi:hypothetical protein